MWMYLLTAIMYQGTSTVQSPNQYIRVEPSISDTGVNLQISSTYTLSRTTKVLYRIANDPSLYKEMKQIVDRSVDVTSVVCDPEVISAYVELSYTYYPNSIETYHVDEALLIGAPIFQCDLLTYYTELVVTLPSSKSYCLYNGYVKVDGKNSLKPLLVKDRNSFYIPEDSCQGPSAHNLEIFSAFKRSLGICLAVVNSQLQKISFEKDEQQLFFPQTPRDIIDSRIDIWSTPDVVSEVTSGVLQMLFLK